MRCMKPLPRDRPQQASPCHPSTYRRTTLAHTPHMTHRRSWRTPLLLCVPSTHRHQARSGRPRVVRLDPEQEAWAVAKQRRRRGLGSCCGRRERARPPSSHHREPPQQHLTIVTLEQSRHRRAGEVWHWGQPLDVFWHWHHPAAEEPAAAGAGTPQTRSERASCPVAVDFDCKFSLAPLAFQLLSNWKPRPRALDESQTRSRSTPQRSAFVDPSEGPILWRRRLAAGGVKLAHTQASPRGDRAYTWAPPSSPRAAGGRAPLMRPPRRADRHRPHPPLGYPVRVPSRPGSGHRGARYFGAWRHGLGHPS